MAQYKVIRSCGHAEIVNLIGKHSDREWRLENVEPVKLCSKCWEAEKITAREKVNEEVRRQAIEQEFPTLIGSDKQIAWALKIRFAVLNDIKTTIARCKIDEKEILDCFAYFKKQGDAKFWIDNRDRSAEDAIQYFINNKNRLVETDDQVNVEKDAREEATVYPDKQLTKDVAEIINKEGRIEVRSPKNDTVINVVKAHGYHWQEVWYLKKSVSNGLPADRIAEIGNALLNAGVPVTIYDEKIRENAIRGNFEPRCNFWILKKDEKHIHTFWRNREDSMYDEAKKLPHARWCNGIMIIATTYYDSIRDFASIYNYKISNDAEIVLRNAEEHDKNVSRVNPEKVKQDLEAKGKLKDILNSSRDILDDLKDD